jgi:hypothetical protein
LYRSDFETFEHYCQKKWNWTKQHVYRLIECAPIAKSNTRVTSIRQAVELAKIPEEKRVEVIQRASETGKVTAKTIHEAAAVVIPKTKSELRESLDLPPEKTFVISAEMLKTDMRRAIKYAPHKKAALLRCASILEQTAKRFLTRAQLFKKHKI